jgi:hypothetical protein
MHPQAFPGTYLSIEERRLRNEVGEGATEDGVVESKGWRAELIAL